MSWKACVECVSEGQLIRRAGGLHANFSQISKEVENARVWGGIHYRTSTVYGTQFGRSPSYPRGPYRFVDSLVITYRTDIDAIRAVVPAPLDRDTRQVLATTRNRVRSYRSA